MRQCRSDERTQQKVLSGKAGFGLSAALGLVAVLAGACSAASAAAAPTSLPIAARVATPRPDSPVEPGGSFSAIGCWSATSPVHCVAVGQGAGANVLAEEQTFTGRQAWHSVEVAKPPGASQSSFAGAACPSATHCLAVGTSTSDGGLKQAAFAETLDVPSGAAHLVPVASPAGSYPGFDGVSCWSASGCMIVGSYSGAAGNVLPWNEVWDGTDLTTAPTAKPKIAYHGISSVSCTSATFCLAVGYAYSEAWNGTRWTSVTPATPSRYSLVVLSAVDCSAPTTCVAVGQGAPPGGPNNSTTLVEDWDGSHWSVVSTADPGGRRESSLDGLACPPGPHPGWQPTGSCLAVGSDEPAPRSASAAGSGSGSGNVPLGEVGSASKWVSVPAAAGSSDGSSLAAVACASPGQCEAVGRASLEGGVATLLAEAWTGSAWQLQPIG